MPTGYTADIAKGIDFNTFAMRCARAMGALVMMRDAPSHAPIPARFEPSQYHAKRAAEARAELLRVEAMTPEQCAVEASGERNAAIVARQERIERRAALRSRYEAMLAEVRAWEPPSSDHVGFKRFMADQITTSIDFDCDSTYDKLPGFSLANDWQQERIAKLREDIDRAERQQREEDESTESRNRWIEQLRDSLKK